MKHLFLTLCVCLLALSASGRQADLAGLIAGAETLFEQAHYTEGLAVLTRAYADQTLTPVQRADVLKALTQFYEDLVGNHDMALNFYSKILRLELAPTDPHISFAQQNSSRLRELKDLYSEEDRVLNTIRKVSNTTDIYVLDENIAELQNLIEAHPDYYKLPEALYYLGMNYLAREHYRRAIGAFRRALELKPAIDIYYLAVSPKIQVAREQWYRSVAGTTAWNIIGGLLVITMVLFYRSRPWRWVRARHIGIAVLMAALWWGFFTLAYRWIGAGFNVPETAVLELRTRLPSLVRSAPGSPGADIMRALGWYGFIGIIGMFVFAVGTSRLKRRRVAFWLNTCAGLLVFASLTTVFYVRYCAGKGEFIAETGNNLGYVTGAVYLYPIDPLPYLLTDPKAYADLEIMDLTQSDFGGAADENADVLRWLIRHYDK